MIEYNSFWINSQAVSHAIIKYVESIIKLISFLYNYSKFKKIYNINKILLTQ